MSLRGEKVGSAIKRILSVEISRLAKEHSAGFASISMVKMSKDLSIANVYFNLLNSKLSLEQFFEVLHQNNGKLRSTVASQVRMRAVPALRFFYDDTLDQMEATENLIKKVKTDSPYSSDYGDTSVYDEKALQSFEDKDIGKK